MRKILIVCLFLLLIPNTAYSSDIIDTLENLGIYDSFDAENDIFPELSYADLASSIEKGQGIDILSVFGKIAEYLIKEFTVHYKLLISIVVAGFAVGVINTIKADEKGIYEASFDISYGIYASLLIYYFIKCINKFDEELTEENKKNIVVKRRKEQFDDKYTEFINASLFELNEKVWEDIKVDTSGSIKTKSFFDTYEKYFTE